MTFALRFPLLLTILLLATLAGCPRTASTPDGGDPAPDAGPMPDASEAPRDARPDGDASPPPPGPDGHISPPRDDGGPPPGEDAGELECSEDDLEAWEHLLRRLDLVDLLAHCGASPSCGERSCTVADCLRHRAGVQGCEPCVSAEISCIQRRCREACAPSSTSERCRWCLCDAGCPFRCSSGSLCTRCDVGSATCAPYLLRVEVLLSVLG